MKLKLAHCTLTHDFAYGYPADETYERSYSDEMDFQPPMMNFFAGIRLTPADRAARMALLEKTPSAPTAKRVTRNRVTGYYP